MLHKAYLWATLLLPPQDPRQRRRQLQSPVIAPGTLPSCTLPSSLALRPPFIALRPYITLPTLFLLRGLAATATAAATSCLCLLRSILCALGRCSLTAAAAAAGGGGLSLAGAVPTLLLLLYSLGSTHTGVCQLVRRFHVLHIHAQQLQPCNHTKLSLTYLGQHPRHLHKVNRFALEQQLQCVIAHNDTLICWIL